MDKREGWIWFWAITVTGVVIITIVVALYYNTMAGWKHIEEQRLADQERCEYVIDSGQPEVIIDNTC